VNFYEPPKTAREWWRSQLRETPVPGRYEFQDFLQISCKRPVYASFKAEGRQKVRGKLPGENLLPGAYEYTDFIEDIKKKPATCSFKSSGRQKQLAWERQQTEVDIFPVPGQYETTPPPVEMQTVASSMFKSKTGRLNNLFRVKAGPPPGHYNPISVRAANKSANSSFASKAPRFKSSGTNVPGPGTYETDRYDRYLGLSIGERRLY